MSSIIKVIVQIAFSKPINSTWLRLKPKYLSLWGASKYVMNLYHLFEASKMKAINKNAKLVERSFQEKPLPMLCFVWKCMYISKIYNLLRFIQKFDHSKHVSWWLCPGSFSLSYICVAAAIFRVFPRQLQTQFDDTFKHFWPISLLQFPSNLPKVSSGLY